MAGNFWKSSHYQEWLLNRQELELGRKEDCEILTNEQLMKLHIFFANFIQSVGEHAQLRQQVCTIGIQLSIGSKGIDWWRLSYC